MAPACVSRARGWGGSLWLTHVCAQVRADRALRSAAATPPAAASAPPSAATEQAPAAARGQAPAAAASPPSSRGHRLSGIHASYDDFLRAPRNTNPAASDVPRAPKAGTAANDGRAALRERLPENTMGAPPARPQSAAKAERSELLHYRQQAIARERAKQRRKEAATKIQTSFRRWLRVSAAPPDAVQSRANHGPWPERGPQHVGRSAHLTSPELSPILRHGNRSDEYDAAPDAAQAVSEWNSQPPGDRDSSSQQWSLHEVGREAHQPHLQQAEDVPKSPPITTHANYHAHLVPPSSAHHDRYRDPMHPSPPRARSAMSSSPTARSQAAHTTLQPPSSPPIRQRHVTPPLAPMAFDQAQIHRLRSESDVALCCRQACVMVTNDARVACGNNRAAVLGHRVRHRMKLHPVKAIVVQIQESARLHAEMKAEVKHVDGDTAPPVELQMLRQLEGTKDGAVEQLAHALTRVEPPVVSAMDRALGAGPSRKVGRERMFLKKGQGRAAVSLDKYKANKAGAFEGGLESAGGAGSVRSRKSLADRAVGSARSGAGALNANSPAPRQLLGATSAPTAEAAVIDGAAHEADPSSSSVQVYWGGGVSPKREGGSRGAGGGSPEHDVDMRFNVLGGRRDASAGSAVDSRPATRDGKGTQSPKTSAAKNLKWLACPHESPRKGVKSAWADAGERDEGDKKAAKPFLKRKTKSVPVSNGPLTWKNVSSKVDARFKGIAAATNVATTHGNPTRGGGHVGAPAPTRTRQVGGASRSTSVGRGLGSPMNEDARVARRSKSVGRVHRVQRPDTAPEPEVRRHASKHRVALRGRAAPAAKGERAWEGRPDLFVLSVSSSSDSSDFTSGAMRGNMGNRNAGSPQRPTQMKDKDEVWHAPSPAQGSEDWGDSSRFGWRGAGSGKGKGGHQIAQLTHTPAADDSAEVVADMRVTSCNRGKSSSRSLVPADLSRSGGRIVTQEIGKPDGLGKKRFDHALSPGNSLLAARAGAGEEEEIEERNLSLDDIEFLLAQLRGTRSLGKVSRDGMLQPSDSIFPFPDSRQADGGRVPRLNPASDFFTSMSDKERDVEVTLAANRLEASIVTAGVSGAGSGTDGRAQASPLAFKRQGVPEIASSRHLDLDHFASSDDDEGRAHVC